MQLEGQISWQYLAGFYDGEGTVGFRVLKEKRASRTNGETEGWQAAPYIQIANTNPEVLETIKDFLNKQNIISQVIAKENINKEQQKGYYLNIQSYEGIRKFFGKICPYTIIKKEQINIVNKFLEIRDNLPILRKGTRIDNLKRNYWTKKLFLEAMILRDKLKNTKFRRNTKHKYNHEYFRKLWGE